MLTPPPGNPPEPVGTPQEEPNHVNICRAQWKEIAAIVLMLLYFSHWPYKMVKFILLPHDTPIPLRLSCSHPPPVSGTDQWYAFLIDFLLGCY